MVRPLGETEAEADDAEPPPVPDAMLPFLGHPYHAYVSPRIPPAAGDGDQEQQQDLLPGLDGMEADKKPLRQLRAYLQRLEAQAARPWWRLRSASYLLLVLVGVCYLGGRSLLLRSQAPPAGHTLNAATHAKLMSLLQPSHGFLPAARLKTLGILATTEGYGAPVNEETRRLYGYSHVLEAGKPVTLRVMDAATAAATGNLTYEWSVRQHDGAELLRGRGLGPEVTVHCIKPCTGVSIAVTELDEKGNVTRVYATDTAVCKFVRREMRKLTVQDRDTYLDALNTFYRVGLDEGRGRYGPHFCNNPFLTAAHNSHKWCLHDPNQFLAVHSAFVYWGEQNMRRIDANVTASPYWDFHIEEALYKDEWARLSPLFHDAVFGPVATRPEDGYVVRGQGRFREMPIARYLGEMYEAFKPGVDAFGFISGNPFTLNAARHVTRTNTVCGLPMALSFAPATNLFECYDWTNDWNRATLCMYMQVHLQLHSHFTGSYNCAYNLSEIHDAFPMYSKELLSFLGVAGRMTWSASAKPGSLLSHRRCNVPKSTTCVCPTLQAETAPYRELYALMEAPLRKASRAYPGDLFIVKYRAKHANGTLSPVEFRFRNADGALLRFEDQDRLLRIIARLWCESAIDSHFVSMASINDPIFYASHTYFDRLAHFLALSPELAQRGFNRTWHSALNARRLRGVQGKEKEGNGDDEVHLHHHPNRAGCLGVAYEDPSPFSHFYFRAAHDEGKRGGKGEEGEEEEEREAYYTMREIDTVLHPRHPSMPYVYDDLMVWGGRRWVPMLRAREDEEDEEDGGGEN